MKFRVAFVQALYGYMSVRAHSDQMMFYGLNCARGLLGADYASITNYAVDQARNGIVETYLASSVTHLLWVDGDMRLPWSNKPGDPDTLTHLLAADKDVIGGTYFGHDDKATIVAWDSLNPPLRKAKFDPNGIQRVGGIGMGCTLVKMDVYRKMHNKYQDRLWYKNEWSGGKLMGEDFWFSKRCQELGIEIWMDGQIRCGHYSEEVADYDKWKRTNS